MVEDRCRLRKYIGREESKFRGINYIQEIFHEDGFDFGNYRIGRVLSCRIPSGQRYNVHGLIRCASTFNTGRIDHIYSDPHNPGTSLFLHYGDLSDSGQIIELIYNIRPDEIYHLGAQSHVRVSFDTPEYTGTLQGLAQRAFSRPYVEAVLKRGIIRHHHQNFSGHRLHRKTKRPSFIYGARTQPPSCMRTG